MARRSAIWLAIGGGILLIAIGLRQLQPEASPLSTSEPEAKVDSRETAEPNLQEGGSPRSPDKLIAPVATPAPAPVEVIDRQDHGDHTLVLVKQSGEYPWVRIEATFEYDEVSESERIVAYEHFAGDRVRVVAKQGVMPHEIIQWAAGIGAQARAIDSPPTRYELIWPEVDIETLHEGLQTVLNDQRLVVLAEPVDLPFEGGVEIEVKEPEGP